MRGMSRSCDFAVGAEATAYAGRPSVLSDGSSCARLALATMIAPGANVWPSAVNDSSAADIFTPAFLNRNDTSELSLLFSTTIVVPVPVMPPGATTVLFIGIIVIGWLRTLLSVISVTVMFRMSGNVQPVSSYGDGFAGAKFWSEKYMSASVRYGWSPRMM